MSYSDNSTHRASLLLPILAFAVSCNGTVQDSTAAGGAAPIGSTPGQVPTNGGSNPSSNGGTASQAAGGAAATGGGSGGLAQAGSTSSVTASGVALKGTPVFHRFVRLTHEQWEASVRDVLKLSALPGLSTSFASDPPNGTFTNNERSLFVSSTLWGDYQRAAETLSAQIAGDKQALARVSGGTTDAAVFVRTLGRRVFRRPLTQMEEQSYRTLFASGATLVGSGDAFADGARLVVETMLQSPNFLYRSEMGADGAPLGGYEMASKLSFLLRNTTPDDALLDAAASGQLDTAQGVLARATTMMEDAPAKSVLGRFHAELFGLERYSGIDKNRTRFPNYTESLNSELQQADRMFFDRVFAAGQGLRQILTSPLAFVSTATARLYGVTVSGSGLVETQLGPERPGFLTRLGYLAYNANLSEPDPIHRGVDILNRLMCLDLLPPADVEIPPVPAALPGQTNRQRVEAHTGDGTCGQGCHSKLINPMGFAFENFDALGQLRTMDNGKSIDTSGSVLLSGREQAFTGAADLAKLLAEAPSVHGCYAKHLTEFTLARETGAGDRALVDQVEGLSIGSNSSIKAIVLKLIAHPSFLTRTGGAS